MGRKFQNAAVIAIISLASTSCLEDIDRRPLRISDYFPACLNLPSGATYRHVERSFDYDVGELTVNGRRIEIYVGHQPNFEERSFPARGNVPDEAFTYVGRERSGGLDRILVRDNGIAGRAKVLVMFSADDLSADVDLLTDADFVSRCPERLLSVTG